MPDINKNSVQFDPEKSLFQLSAVRWAALISLSLACVTATVIALAANKTEVFTWSGAAFNSAIELYKVPLGILAVGLTLIGIFGANHRSEQTRRQIERTATQIELTRSQNNFSNYYKHLEEFEKYCKSHISSFKINSTRSLYGKIFINSQSGNYQASTYFINKFTDMLDLFFSLCNKLDSFSYNDREAYYLALIDIIDFRTSFLEFACLDDIAAGRSGTQIQEQLRSRIIPGGNLRTLFEVSIGMFETLDEILKFDLRYKSPERLTSLAKVNPEYITTLNVTSSVVSYHFEKLLNDSSSTSLS
jgi:hypothetical protein